MGFIKNLITGFDHVVLSLYFVTGFDWKDLITGFDTEEYLRTRSRDLITVLDRRV